MKIIGNSKLTSDFDLASLPPTSCVTREHSFRVYHTLQQWEGNILDPCKWGWMKDDDELKPVFTSKPLIPERLAEMISCNCKSGCGKRRRVGNECSVLCTHCNGVDCLNCPKPIDDYDSI